MSASASTTDDKMQKLTFEVFGKVQRVFFRKHTVDKATALGLSGHCSNTRAGTVTGEAVGPKAAIEQFQHWLRHEGSPQCEIHDAKFTLSDAEAKDATASFEVRRH